MNDTFTECLYEIEEIERLPEGTMLMCPLGDPHDYHASCIGSGLETREERLTRLEFELDILCR